MGYPIMHCSIVFWYFTLSVHHFCKIHYFVLKQNIKQSINAVENNLTTNEIKCAPFTFRWMNEWIDLLNIEKIYNIKVEWRNRRRAKQTRFHLTLQIQNGAIFSQAIFTHCCLPLVCVCCLVSSCLISSRFL